MLRICVCLSVSLCSLSVFAADNWPEFRGPAGDGRTAATKLPVTWSETENVKWKTAIHGKGWSSPVIWDDQIWLTTAPVDGKQMQAVCIDKNTGKVVHDLTVFEIEKPAFCHDMNSYATPTPAIEAGRVFVHYGTHGTACIDTTTGKILWKREDLHCDHWRGPASSPILWENLMIVNFDGYDVQYVVALDKKTGQTVWKKDRNINYGTSDGDQKKGYCTPTVFKINGEYQLVNPSAGAVISYQPLTGEEIWRVNCGGMNSAARPILGQGLIFANTAAGGIRQFAIKMDGHGDVTKTHIAWKNNREMPTRPSPILDGEYLFTIADAGIINCLEAKTGKSIWSKRLEGAYSASPIFAAGRIYFFSQDGETPVIEAKPEFKLLATNKLDAGFMASPAVSGQAIYLRTKTHLYRVEGGGR